MLYEFTQTHFKFPIFKNSVKAIQLIIGEDLANSSLTVEALVFQQVVQVGNTGWDQVTALSPPSPHSAMLPYRSQNTHESMELCVNFYLIWLPLLILHLISSISNRLIQFYLTMMLPELVLLRALTESKNIEYDRDVLAFLEKAKLLFCLSVFS